MSEQLELDFRSSYEKDMADVCSKLAKDIADEIDADIFKMLVSSSLGIPKKFDK